MDCPNCRLQYNDSERAPRLLVACGQSICEKCIADLYRDNSIVCPQCLKRSTVPSITCFPRNEDLINFLKQNKAQHPPQLSIDFSQFCQKHTKKFEAFCPKERQLICVTCIIEDGHHTHHIDSLDKAYHRELDELSTQFQQVKQTEDRLLAQLQQIDEGAAAVQDVGERHLIEITRFYNEIRKLVNDREVHLKQKIKEQMLREEKALKQREQGVRAHLQCITEFLKEYRMTANLNECQFLAGAAARHNVAAQALQNVDTLEIFFPFQDVNREQEITALVKQILAQKSASNHNNSSGQPDGPTLHKSKKQRTGSNVNLASNVTQGNGSTGTTGGGSSSNNSSSNNSSSSNAAAAATTSSNNNIGGHHNHHQTPIVVNVKVKSQHQNAHKNTQKATPNMKKNKATVTNKELQNVPINPSVGGGSSTPLPQKDQLTTKQPIPVTLHFNLSQSQNVQAASSTYAEHKGEKKQDQIKRSQSPISNTTNHGNSKGAKNLNNYKEMRDILKERLNNDRVVVVHTTSAQGGEAAEPMLSSSSTGNTTPQKRINNCSSRERLRPSKSPQSNQILQSRLYAQQDNENLSAGHFYDTLRQIDGAQLAPTVAPKNLNEDFDLSAIINEKNEKEESLKGEYKSFLHESSAKQFGADMSEICINKCDFSTLYSQQANQYVYVIGGFIENTRFSIERLDLARGQWEEVDHMVTNRAKFQMVALSNGNVLILGGKQDGVRVALCEEYCVRDKKMKMSALQLTRAKSGFGVACKNDQIYIIGGHDEENILSNAEMYDYKLKKTTQLAEMREKRDELAVTIGNDDKIYAIGGVGGALNQCLKSVERYNYILDKWEPVANLNVSRRALSAVALPDGIYAIGGFDGGNYLSSVERYDEQLNQWVLICSMNFPRCTLSAVATPNSQHIYVFGGFDKGPLNCVERYSVIDNSWEMVQPMKYKRFMHCSLLLKH